MQLKTDGAPKHTEQSASENLQGEDVHLNSDSTDIPNVLNASGSTEISRPNIFISQTGNGNPNRILDLYTKILTPHQLSRTLAANQLILKACILSLDPQVYTLKHTSP